MHFDTTRQIDVYMRKLDAIIKHGNKAGFLSCNGQQIQVHIVTRLAQQEKREDNGRRSNEETDAHNE